MQQSRSNRPKASGSQKTGPIKIKEVRVRSSAPKGKGKSRRRSSSVDRIERFAAPVSYGVVEHIAGPKIARSKNGDIRVAHREYLGEVTGQTAFTSVQYRVQPGSSRTFPWLSSTARRFEKYRINNLRFCYETDCSTATAGTVMLIPDFDSTDNAPVTKSQALQYRSSARGAAWTKFTSDFKKEDLQALPQYYITGNAPPSGTDVKLYQVANMFLCVAGMAGAAVVGELWVEYDISLITPDNSSLSYDKSTGTVTSPSAAAPLGTAIGDTGVLSALDYTWLTGTTLVINEAWRGNVNWLLTGTVLTGATITGGTVGDALIADVLNSAATSELLFKFINVVPGDVLTFTSNATSLTASVVYFSAA